MFNANALRKKLADERIKSIAKTNLHPEKMILSVSLDCKEIIYFELFPVGQTINSDKYCQQFKDSNPIQEKPPILANHKGIFHHNNAKSHCKTELV